jgi:hypothetical protein
MPGSHYAGGFVTPTRRHNVEDDLTSSDEEDDDDALYSNLVHPVYGHHDDQASPSSHPMGTSSAPSGHISSELATRVLQPSSSASSGHDIQPPSSADIGSAASPPCPWHGEEILDMYCIQCKVLVCNRCCLFGHHSGHPRIPAAEAYDEVRKNLADKPSELQRLEDKCRACEGRMDGERERVAKSRSAMKKSLRSSVKSLRDMLNQKQNELMEVIREEEETKLAHGQDMAGSLVQVHKELDEAARSANIVAQVKKDCPYILETANALEARTAAVDATLREIDGHIAILPASFKFHLNDRGLREGIRDLSLQPGVAGQDN